jgi:hypothetical protein
MPVISRFLGIIISMFWNDHAPPHFHAKYGDFEITVEIESGIVSGKFPPRAMRHVLEWREQHLEELRSDWALCRQAQMPLPIAPLE